MVRRKADANQAEITLALRAAGVPYWDLSSVGGGCPDLLTRTKAGEYLFLEVKTKAGKLRPAQVEAAQIWNVRVVRDVEEALLAVGVRA